MRSLTRRIAISSSLVSVRPVFGLPPIQNRQRQIPGTPVATMVNSIPL